MFHILLVVVDLALVPNPIRLSTAEVPNSFHSLARSYLGGSTGS